MADTVVFGAKVWTCLYVPGAFRISSRVGRQLRRKNAAAAVPYVRDSTVR